MGCVRRRDRACHDSPRHSIKVDDVAGILARGVMRLRDESCDLARSLRLMPSAGEADCHTPLSPASRASAGREPAPTPALPPP